MLLWYWLRRLYSLDTLDTRFVTSAKAPIQASAGLDATKQQKHISQNGNPARSQRLAEGALPSLWNTPEYYFYYLVFVTIIPCMFYVPYTVSRDSDPQYHKFESLLSDGWIPGRKVDNSDLQYASFRNNIPYMAILVLVHPLLRRLYNVVVPVKSTESTKRDDRAEASLNQRINFDLPFTVVFLFALHGFGAFKPLFIVYLNFKLATKLPARLIVPATWAFGLAVLFANELCKGYPYVKIARVLFFYGGGDKSSPALAWARWLDDHGGLVPRWEVLFNITVLRLISFNLDYYWKLQWQASSALEKKQLTPTMLTERDRVTIPASTHDYTMKPYLSYTLYTPLYLAGPIITFNDYISQLRYPAPSITTPRTILYGIRFLLTLLTMELVLHFIYAVAISKSDPDWSAYTPFQLSMLAFFNLHIIWLKLLLPWRFFRLWALIDGIDPPENMVRCMSDNYSALAFWRGWHRSFNRWIVRYVYIPLGGSGGGNGMVRSVFNMLVVFTFVALWHDISARLLAWSWLIILFVLPELVCSTVLFPAKKYRDRPELYRWLSGVGAVGNILMMMAANLVGFAVGLDGLQGMVQSITASLWGWTFLVLACATLFTGVMVMFEIRETEKRKGINLKC